MRLHSVQENYNNRGGFLIGFLGPYYRDFMDTPLAIICLNIICLKEFYTKKQQIQTMPYFCGMARKKNKRKSFEDIEVIDAGSKGKGIGKAPDGRVLIIDKVVPGDVVQFTNL